MQTSYLAIGTRSAGKILATALVALLTGCSGFNSKPIAAAGPAMRGIVHGGQQPIANATLTLFAAGTTSYSAANTNLFTTPVTTDGSGSFTFGPYKCTKGQEIYVVATGGNPGAGTNNNIALMAALGDCSTLTPSTDIDINEITTIGSVFALAPFMSSSVAVGSSPTNSSGLMRAFASVNKLVNFTNGQPGGSALPAGATAPIREMNTLADIIAACINSTGGVAGDRSICGTLFALTTPSGGTAPTDTIQAALNIAHNPTLNVTALFNSSPANSPFTPQLSSAPNDWTLAVTYSTGGFNAPQSTTIDASGNIWVANAGGNSVSVLAQTGLPVTGSPFTGNGLDGPAAVAIDAGGNAWIANQGGSSVSVFSSSGITISGSPFAGSGTISAPTSIAIDAPGNIWIANSGNSSVSQLTSAGTYRQQVTSNIVVPKTLAINPK
jgi:hypothetical protein